MLVLLLLAVPSAWAQEREREPTPKELWDAYPLQPGEASPTPTVGSDVPSARTVVAPTDDEEPGTPWYVPALLAVPLAVGAAVIAADRRRRRARAEAEAAAPPMARRSFGWEHFPPPARPAPPAPPPPPFRGGRR